MAPTSNQVPPGSDQVQVAFWWHPNRVPRAHTPLGVGLALTLNPTLITWTSSSRGAMPGKLPKDTPLRDRLGRLA